MTVCAGTIVVIPYQISLFSQIRFYLSLRFHPDIGENAFSDDSLKFHSIIEKIAVTPKTYTEINLFRQI